MARAHFCFGNVLVREWADLVELVALSLRISEIQAVLITWGVSIIM